MRRTFRLLSLVVIPCFVAFGCSQEDSEVATDAREAAPAATDAADGLAGREESYSENVPAPAAAPTTAASASRAAVPTAGRKGGLSVRPPAAEALSSPDDAPGARPPPKLKTAPRRGKKEVSGLDSKTRPHRPGPSGGSTADKEQARLDRKSDRDGSGLLDESRSIAPNMYFKHYGVNPTIDTEEESASTFATDVDTASYAMARSLLSRGVMPPEAAVRVEEIVNAFDYNYQAPTDDIFNIHAEAAPSPNRPGYHVLHIGVKGKEVSRGQRKNANLVFVIDVSGSMAQDNRLGLVKRSLRLLVNQLNEADKVGIVTYGSSARQVLQPTAAYRRQEILRVIDNLKTEGATNAEAGLRLGYQMASKHFRAGGINRVVLCSDGVANMGVTGSGGILATVKRETDRGITISTVGFGMGNYNDVLMEQLADKGNGNYYYVDKLAEARRVFVDQLTGTLQVIAKDVKIQVEFDPKVVARYRLIGYENRQLKRQEFSDDRVDAGEIGAGHSVTAIYEVKLRPGTSAPLGVVRIRYKQPAGNTSRLIQQSLARSVVRTSEDSLSSPTQLSLVAAQFAEKLRGSYWARNVSYDDILRRFDRIATPLRQRADVVELRHLVQRARDLDRRGDKFVRHGPVARMNFDRVPVLR